MFGEDDMVVTESFNIKGRPKKVKITSSVASSFSNSPGPRVSPTTKRSQTGLSKSKIKEIESASPYELRLN